MEKHLFRPNGQYFDRQLAIEKQKEVNEVVMPLVNKFLDEGYSLSEILHFIFGTVEFELMNQRKLSR